MDNLRFPPANRYHMKQEISFPHDYISSACPVAEMLHRPRIQNSLYPLNDLSRIFRLPALPLTEGCH